MASCVALLRSQCKFGNVGLGSPGMDLRHTHPQDGDIEVDDVWDLALAGGSTHCGGAAVAVPL
jgi:hypothetical protein